MSRHEGVSCDSCSKNNFRGKRFKCLVCYDYDLCSQCHESGAATTKHTKDHPMQCILTRSDFELYYGGESLTVDQPQSFTCPFCGKLGLTESGLPEHVSLEHPEMSSEVVCPVCAALPRGEPNHMTDDFIAHLTMEHRTQSMRDFDEPTGSRVRRILHGGRTLGQRARRATNQNFGNSTSATPQFGNSSSTAVRDTIDPIAELLSQLSGVRRSAQQSQQSVQSQLQLLQQQLQFERQQVQQTRERLERLPRRPMNSAVASATPATTAVRQDASLTTNSAYLLTRCYENELPENEQSELEERRANRSIFVQDLLVSTLESVNSSQHGELEDFEIENVLTTAAVSDMREEDQVSDHEENTLANDMELINLEEENEKEL